MSPRKYEMGKRAAAVAETRARIVDAARQLHGERGIAATGWDDIAARAGVGVGTVYRHFPSLDELIPACGAAVMESVAPPAPADVPALFTGAAKPAARIATLVREAYGLYERGAPQLRAMRRERDVHPGVAQADDELAASLRALVETALEPLDPSDEDRAVARAMIDLSTWEALREQGLDAVRVTTELLTQRLTGRRAPRT